MNSAKLRKTPQRAPKKRPPPELAGLLSEGKTYTQIGENLGVDRERIAAWHKLPEIQEQIRQIQAEAGRVARQRLAALQAPAVQVVGEVLGGSGQDGTCETCGRSGAAEARDRLRAAEMVFDRTGLPRTEVQQQEHVLSEDEQLSDEELEARVLRAAADVLRWRGEVDLAKALEDAS